jgi:UDP-N-acetyl-D-mannosaminuronate dehydrogenase
VLKPGDIVIYESTVYPGATEEDCVPVLERLSGLTFNKDFFAGYSPERINPGDKEHTVTKIKKVTSGSTPEAAQKVDAHFNHPEIILAGRRLNDNMGKYVASEVVKLMIARDHKIKGAKVLILGITFKENCPDIRNTRVVDIVHELRQYGTEVYIYDPWANPEEVLHEYNLHCLTQLPATHHYDAAILAVAHTLFTTIPLRTIASCIYDIKNVLPADQVDGRL